MELRTVWGILFSTAKLAAEKLAASAAALVVVAALVGAAALAGGWFGRALASPDMPDAAPGLVSYQGYLTDAGGQAFTGTAALTFELFDAPQGGAVLWSETQNNVTVSSGYFSVLLGSVTALNPSHFNGASRYLQVSVNTGGGAVVMPRQRLASVPYAFQAERAPWKGLSGVPAGFADGVDGVSYAQVVSVAKAGGDFTSIQAALDSIVDADASKRYLVWIGPGEYAEQVIMKPYIDLQGSGENMTMIKTAGFGLNNTGTLMGAPNAEARFLRVENTGGTAYAIAIFNAAVDTRYTHVTAAASGGPTAVYGVYNTSGTPVFQNVTVIASCSGGTTCNGIYNIGSSPLVRDTSIEVTALGGGMLYGINSTGGASTLDGVTVSTSAPTNALANNNFGILQTSGSPSLNNVIVLASGANQTYALYSTGGQPRVRSSSFTATSGGGADTGVYYSAGVNAVLEIFDSQITSANNTIYNAGNGSVRVASTQLDGLSTLGTVICAGVYDENFAFSANACP